MALESYSLVGKTVLITGGAGLLGVQHAAAILEAGGSVVITDLKKIDLTKAKQELLKSHLYLGLFVYPTEKKCKTNTPLTGCTAV